MKNLLKNVAILLSMFALTFLVACGDDVGHDDHDHHGHSHDPNEVMTTIKLNFTPEGGGESFTATWADPENDGTPMIDDITLTNGETYTVSIEILNELEMPAEDVTPEILQEKDEHQFFFYGTAVQGPSNTENTSAVVEQSYADMDTQNFPVGLSNTFTATATGTGVLTVTLRHMPPINGNPVKTGTLADVVNTGSVSDLPGSSDITVDFNVIVE